MNKPSVSFSAMAGHPTLMKHCQSFRSTPLVSDVAPCTVNHNSATDDTFQISEEDFL
jgi:hypothetical protein